MRVLHIAWGYTPFRGGGLIDYTEDLMAVQRAQGYEVAYFCAARRSLLSARPRLKKWTQREVRMYEVLNSPIYHTGDDGPVSPAMDLNEEHSEKFFLEALTEFKPDIIQIQELAGLPFSLIRLAQLRGIPVVHTLHDYYPLCPTVKLYDKEGTFCTSRQIGEKCVACCAQAKKPDMFSRLGATLWYASNRPGAGVIALPAKVARRTMKGIGRVPLQLVRQVASRRAPKNSSRAATPVNRNLAEIFQRRRDTNIELLNQLDLLVAQSFRQAEIYESLGIERSKLVVVPSTQKHIEHLKPKAMNSISPPVNFVTLNGCNTKQKGAHLILEAVRRLNAMGLAEQFKLYILGYVADDIKDEMSQLKNVVCKGTYTLRELEGLLEDAHVGIVPSIWEEVYGIVGIELLAKGIPIIGNSLGGIVDYTKDNLTGWVNRENTAAGLARIMAGIIAEPDQIARLNQSILENHSRIVKTMKTHFDEMHDLYRSVLDARQNKRAAACIAY